MGCNRDLRWVADNRIGFVGSSCARGGEALEQICLKSAMRMVAAAFAKGREIGTRPLTIAILDRGDALIILQRQDGSSLRRPEIAIGKASGALALGMSSRAIEQMARERPNFIAALSSNLPSGLIPAAGGLLVGDDKGLIVGAIGITGDTSENDELCARAGVEAAGFAVIE